MDGGRALRASRTKRIFVHARAHVTTRRAARTVNLRARARVPFLLKKKRISCLDLIDRPSLIRPRLDDPEFLIRRLARLTRRNAEVIVNVSSYYLLRWQRRERKRERERERERE